MRSGAPSSCGSSGADASSGPRLGHTGHTLAGVSHGAGGGIAIGAGAGVGQLGRGTGGGERSHAGGASARGGAVAGEVFPSLVARDVAEAEERYLTAFECGLARLSETVDRAVAGRRSWLSRARAGLVALLGFFDDEPEWARLLVCEAPVGDALLALRCEQRVQGVLSGVLDDGAPQAVGELTLAPEMTAELVMGGIFALLRSRLGDDEERALVELAPPLMALIAVSYLGQAAAQAELAGSGPHIPELPTRSLTMREAGLPIRVTHRTTLVLRAIFQEPGASNRDVMRAAGPIDEGQLSKLLARLAERGLIENASRGAEWGEPNAWRLTLDGERALRVIGSAPMHSPRRVRDEA